MPPPVISFGSDYTVDESAGTIHVTLTRTGDLSATSTVNYIMNGGTATLGQDYNAPAGTVSNTVTFAAGSSTSSFDLVINDDTLTESAETIVLGIHAPTNATIGDDELTITINASDPDLTAPLLNAVSGITSDRDDISFNITKLALRRSSIGRIYRMES